MKHPASFGQEQMWFVDRFHADVPMHNVPVTIRLRGPLDADALGRALDALVARHEALRTRLVPGADGRPVQVVDPPLGLELTEAPEPDRRFSLEDGPLLRAHLTRLADDDHVLLIVAHAIVFDAGSIDVLLRDLAALYRGEALSEPVRFTDLARRERERLQGATLAGLVRYWRDRLDGFPNLQLPTDRPRPIVADHKGDVEHLNLGADLLDGLRDLSREEGTTLPVALMAGLQALLQRYTAQDDIVVGAASRDTAVSPGSPPRPSDVIGPLATMLPIRTDLSGDPTFRELLGRVHAVTEGAHEHRDLPFAKLVEELEIERDTGRPPVFQVALTVTEAPEPIEARRVSDAREATARTPHDENPPRGRRSEQSNTVIVELERVDRLAARFDLDFFAEVRAGELRVEVSYATALFEAETMRRLLGHLRVLLAGAVQAPSRRLSELPVLTDAELHRELVEWNDTARDFPVTCIHEGFEAQAERTPKGVAAEMGGESVTYGELNADANRIARRLHDLGAGPEVLVGVSMAPSIRRLAVLLGIMKAGGGYVPLDPALPTDRLSFMIEDTGMPLIVADADAALPATAARIVHADDPEIAQLADDNPAFGAVPSNLAYVIYTSGSTGRPKGVMVEHRHALNFLVGMIGDWRITPDDRVLQFASLNFDVSVMDMFMTLLAGARAVLAPPEVLLAPPRLADLMRDRRVTFACMPPAVVNLLTGQDFPDLRMVLSAGEELSGELVRKWLRPGLEFMNGYGPTEAAIGSTYSRIDGTMFPPPIGRPKPNYQAYVLDAHLNPVPVGVAGELHVGGAGVTRGYLNAPELTERRFIPDPFRPGGRLYKTGDLVRRMPDGNLVFLGRIDGQVKIRGLRVELGEIETALVSHPAVAQAVVTLVEDRSGEKQLAGYVRFGGSDVSVAREASARTGHGQNPPRGRRSEQGKPVSVADLRQHLAQRVPAYMVPTYLRVVDAFPLNTNGKIDHAALPAPDSAERTAAYAAPRTIVETVLTDMYARLLGRERVGIDDGFFDLGGNSLQAMQLITQLRSDLVVDLDIAAVFLAPTPRQLTVVLCDEHGIDDADISAELAGAPSE